MIVGDVSADGQKAEFDYLSDDGAAAGSQTAYDPTERRLPQALVPDHFVRVAVVLQ